LRGRVPSLFNQGGSMIHMTDLAAGIEPLRLWFNDKSAYARIVAIQSPT
jgi:hypothetical protein